MARRWGAAWPAARALTLVLVLQGRHCTPPAASDVAFSSAPAPRPWCALPARLPGAAPLQCAPRSSRLDGAGGMPTRCWAPPLRGEPPRALRHDAARCGRGVPLLPLRAQRRDEAAGGDEPAADSGWPPPDTEPYPGAILLPDGVTPDQVVDGEAEPEWIFAGPVRLLQPQPDAPARQG